MSYLKVKSLVNLPTLFSVHTAICQLNFKIYSKITFNDDTNEITYKIQTQTRKQTYGCWGKEIVQDFGKVMYTLLYLKWITNKTYCIANGTLLNVMYQPGTEGAVWGRMDTCICISEFLRCSPETTTILLIGYTPTQNVYGVK